MSNNDLVLLKQLLDQKRKEIAPSLPESEFFEVFVTEQVLKDHDLSYDEIIQGIVDGGGDGGIDGVFLFINGCLVGEAIDSSGFRRGVPVDLVLLQAKTSNGFSETSVEKIFHSVSDLLDFSKDMKSLKSVYKADLLGKIGDFRESYLALASKFPKLSIRIFNASLGNEVHPNVRRKVDPIKGRVTSLFSPSDFEFEFLTATKLLELARKAPVSAHQLTLAESPIATGDQGYLCLVNLNEFATFITDDDGTIKERVFEGNVRDYQGNTEVNQAIRQTLSTTTDEDFWWLNNGISIVCDSATLSGKTLTLETPEVVNGLQTSREIFDVFKGRQKKDRRNLLVRILVPTQDESRDRIIRATNSQTSIPIASLRATDRIHKNIEDFFAARGLYYDRRKNYYKNSGKPIESIVSISALAQHVLSCALRDPGNARARPSSLLKKDTEYDKIFNESHPLEIYYNSVVLGQKIYEAFRSAECSVPREHWNNIRYYALMLLGLRASGTVLPSVQQVADIDATNVDHSLCLECINNAWTEYDRLGASDQAAKGNELGQLLIEQHRKNAKQERQSESGSPDGNSS